ncbi:MAG: NAD(+)/NADH kinase [Rhodospirillales bacterium]|nr:NAD(+)/NADH kinase [Rhodospirillales bacterium]
MNRPKIHFSYEPGKENIETFASSLISELGQESYADADVVVTVGGDGSLLHAFRASSDGQKVFGLMPPGSNSTGFWTNRGPENAQQLLQSLKAAKSYIVNPICAEITFADGQTKLVKAFNDAVAGEDSGQAMLAELQIEGPGGTIGPIRIMGDGLIFATAFGSTAVSRTYGGPAIDIRNSGIILTGKGVYEPKEGFRPIVATDDTMFEINFLSPSKRPVRLQYDGLFIRSEMNNPFQKIRIAKDHNHGVELLLLDDPSTRAFSAMMP